MVNLESFCWISWGFTLLDEVRMLYKFPCNWCSFNLLWKILVEFELLCLFCSSLAHTAISGLQMFRSFFCFFNSNLAICFSLQPFRLSVLEAACCVPHCCISTVVGCWTRDAVSLFWSQSCRLRGATEYRSILVQLNWFSVLQFSL